MRGRTRTFGALSSLAAFWKCVANVIEHHRGIDAFYGSSVKLEKRLSDLCLLNPTKPLTHDTCVNSSSESAQKGLFQKQSCRQQIISWGCAQSQPS
eukprot:3294133-Amphidinium_carterae.1